MSYILKLTVLQKLPFTFVESEEFINVINYYAKGKPKIMKADAFTDYAMQQFIAYRELLRGQFEKIDSQVSLTVDGWTLPTKNQFLA